MQQLRDKLVSAERTAKNESQLKVCSSMSFHILRYFSLVWTSAKCLLWLYAGKISNAFEGA